MSAPVNDVTSGQVAEAHDDSGGIEPCPALSERTAALAHECEQLATLHDTATFTTGTTT